MGLADALHKISSVKLSTYGLISGIVTFNGAGICILLYNWAQRVCMATPHFKMAINTFDGHEEAKRLLGEPVKIGKLNMLDKKQNYMRVTESKFHIPVCGAHTSGFLDVFANKNKDEAMFTTQRMVLELENGERFLMYDRPGKEEEEKRRKEAEEKVPKKRPRGR